MDLLDIQLHKLTTENKKLTARLKYLEKSNPNRERENLEKALVQILDASYFKLTFSTKFERCLYCGLEKKIPSEILYKAVECKVCKSKRKEVERKFAKIRTLEKNKASGKHDKWLKYLSELSKTPEYKAKRNKALQERRKSDALFNLTCRVRNLIQQSFSRKNKSKSLTTIKILGCTIPEFKKHLESLFVDGMSFENAGAWHIDHKTPLATAKTKEDVIRLCHYSNLQPLWKIDNLKKGHRI